MTSDYAQDRIAEALRLNGNNAAKARRQLQTWFYEDPRLLIELTRPHWAGIVGYAVDRVLQGAPSVPARKPRSGGKGKPAATPANSGPEDTLEQRIGKEMLRSFAAQNTARFGHESGAPPVKRQSASQNHVDAIHLIAAKSRKRDKKT